MYSMCKDKAVFISAIGVFLFLVFVVSVYLSMFGVTGESSCESEYIESSRSVRNYGVSG